jgi:hypothetical protein
MAVAPAAAGAIAGGKLAGDTASGIIKDIAKALEHDFLSLHFERDPKNYKKMRLASFDINVSDGLILGGVALALIWEIGNWFANAMSKGEGTVVNILEDIISPASFVTSIVTDILGNVVKDPQGNPKTVQAPATFGGAFNLAMRNITLAGPGTAAQAAMNAVAKYTT